jgi:hypothetical protein
LPVASRYPLLLALRRTIIFTWLLRIVSAHLTGAKCRVGLAGIAGYSRDRAQPCPYYTLPCPYYTLPDLPTLVASNVRFLRTG